MGRPQDRDVEPLFAALEEDREARSGSTRSGLLWRIVVAALVFAGLLAIVLNQAY